MKIAQEDHVLNITELDELSAANSRSFRERLHAILPDSLKAIEIDLSRMRFIDSSGLGALISVYKQACSVNGGIPVRLLNPTPPVQQVFELTRMHRLFQIIKR